MTIEVVSSTSCNCNCWRDFANLNSISSIEIKPVCMTFQLEQINSLINDVINTAFENKPVLKPVEYISKARFLLSGLIIFLNCHGNESDNIITNSCAKHLAKFWLSNDCFCTSEDVKLLNSEFLNKIISFVRVNDIVSLLSLQNEEENTLFSEIISDITNLLDDRGKINVNSVVYFSNLVKLPTFPYPSNFVNNVIPGIVTLLESGDTQFVTTSLECIVHVVDHCASSELIKYGYADLFVNHLDKQLFSGNKVLTHLLNCYIKILSILENPSSVKQLYRKHSVLLTRLTEMAIMENKEEVQLVLWTNMHIILKVIQIQSIFVRDRIFEVLNLYLNDAPSNYSEVFAKVLQFAHDFMIFCWLRFTAMSSDLEQIMSQLMKERPNIDTAQAKEIDKFVQAFHKVQVLSSRKL